MKSSELIGSWRLIKHGRQNQRGEFRPTSSFLSGKLIYTANGHMSVFIVTKERSENLKDIIVYSGRYTLQSDRILHHIDISPSPARVGSTETRFFEFISPILRLSTLPDDEGHNYIIEWEKES